jgi:hypothetical protein
MNLWQYLGLFQPFFLNSRKICEEWKPLDIVTDFFRGLLYLLTNSIVAQEKRIEMLLRNNEIFSRTSNLILKGHSGNCWDRFEQRERRRDRKNVQQQKLILPTMKISFFKALPSQKKKKKDR